MTQSIIWEKEKIKKFPVDWWRRNQGNDGDSRYAATKQRLE